MIHKVVNERFKGISSDIVATDFWMHASNGERVTPIFLPPIPIRLSSFSSISQVNELRHAGRALNHAQHCSTGRWNETTLWFIRCLLVAVDRVLLPVHKYALLTRNSCYARALSFSLFVFRFDRFFRSFFCSSSTRSCVDRNETRGLRGMAWPHD